MKLIVTGGAGFIGSAVCRYLIANTDYHVVNVDKLTYAANPASLTGITGSRRYLFIKADIAHREAMRAIIAQVRPDAILNLAAESHVDRSIDAADTFIRTNINGTFILLEEARRYWDKLPGSSADRFRFHHVSTDEVFGALGAEGFFNEDTAYNPSSPYSASKAASDHLVRAWGRTYGLPILITNCCNNYGPYQFPEKLIPLMILRAVQGQRLPVYGKGENIRDWLYVDDHADALLTVLRHGQPGETYNIGASAERRNIDLVYQICDFIDELAAPLVSGPRRNLIRFVEDRPGHDWRYAIDATRLREQLGWKPRHDFDTGLRNTVQWYLDNQKWWQSLLEASDALERQGQIQKSAPVANMATTQPYDAAL